MAGVLREVKTTRDHQTRSPVSMLSLDRDTIFRFQIGNIHLRREEVRHTVNSGRPRASVDFWR